MKALHFDVSAGAAGDMICASLLDAGADRQAFDALVGSLGIDGVRVFVEERETHALRALGLRVEHPEQHVHRHLSDVEKIIDAATLTPGAKTRARAIFRKLAEAEAEVHGTTPEHVHFHEVGAVDSIVDILGAALLLDDLAPERITASAVRTGYGTVDCAHGKMPVPAPATALLLRGVPSFAGEFEAEQCTPTGAAILAASVDAFGPMPMMRTTAVGQGAGTRPAPFPNLVRAFVGTTASTGAGAEGPVVAGAALEGTTETMLVEVEAHLDDSDGEALGHLKAALLDGPALDVVVTPVQAKKDRPGVLIRALGPDGSERELLRCLFRHSSTLGARVRRERRVHLVREEVVIETALGPVRAKKTTFEGLTRLHPEHTDLAEAAARHQVGLHEARAAFWRAAAPA
jgi:uncharacterized protein (TIGR00299 family) protein